MTALRFTWEDIWNFYDALEGSHLKDHLEEEIIGDGWLARQPAKKQLKILEGAPEGFINRIIKELKPEVAIELGHNPYVWKERK